MKGRYLTNYIQSSLNKDSQPRDIPHSLAGDTNTDFSRQVLQSGFPVEHGGRILLPIDSIPTKRIPHSMAQLVPGETVAGSEQRPSHPLSPINDLSLPIKHEGELANNLRSPENLIHPQAVYSEEDEVWNPRADGQMVGEETNMSINLAIVIEFKQTPQASPDIRSQTKVPGRNKKATIQEWYDIWGTFGNKISTQRNRRDVEDHNQRY